MLQVFQRLGKHSVIYGVSTVLNEIAAVLLIGLIADLLFTWLQNSVILRWYVKRKGE